MTFLPKRSTASRRASLTPTRSTTSRSVEPGARNITVYTAGGNATQSFTVDDLTPSISGLSKSSGTVPTTVTISGSNLATASSIVWNGYALSFTVSGSTLVASIPAYATAPALFYVACLMARGLTEVEWDDVTEAAPAVITALAMPFTFSIAMVVWGRNGDGTLNF